MERTTRMASVKVDHQSPSRGFAAFWLIYLVFVFVEPVMARSRPAIWLVSLASVAAFLPLYFGAFANIGRNPRRSLLLACLMVAMGLLMVPVNIGGSTYVIFAASVAVFVLPRRTGLLFSTALAGLLLATTLLARRSMQPWMFIQPLMVLMVGIGNLLAAEERRRNLVVRRAQEEVEEMAKVAERERIARDLHDLLGHTLSVIALKSELASRLVDSDPQRAAVEIRDVERVSRTALTEVRSAVEGYRARGLSGELAGAADALAAAEITLERAIEPVALTPRRETVLALAVREAVTNVIRHARARRCRISLSSRDGTAVLTVEDDGVGGTPGLVEGAGLTGMRERVQAVGGSLRVDRRGGGNTAGVALTVRMPMGQDAGSAA